MPILPVNIGEVFANKTLRKYYGTAIAPSITNQDYEPMASKGGTDRVHLLLFLSSVTLNNYTPGTDMTDQTWLGDIEDTLLLDQKKYYSVPIDDLNKFEAYVNDLDSYIIEDAAGILQQTIDAYVLGTNTYYDGVKAGHRIGSNFIRNSAYISAAGAVTSDGGINGQTHTTGAFTAAMATNHLGISFDAGVTWYRISAFTSSSSITITDWNSSTFTGGALSDKTITIEAGASVAVTSSNFYGKVVDLAGKLTADRIPTDNRWLVLHPDIGVIARQDSNLIPAVAAAYEGIVTKGLLGTISGFKVYESADVAGNNTTGYYCLAGHKSAITFAHSFKESRVMVDDNQFAKKYQGLNVYGAVVPVERRKALAYLLCTK